MVGAGDRGRRDEAAEADLLEASLGQVERFEAAAHVLGIDHLLAGELLRVADALDDEHRVVDAAVVERFADLLLRRRALALVDDVLEDVLHRGRLGAGERPAQRLVALGLLATGAGVVIAAGPPDADQLVHREVVLGRFLDRGGVHRAPALVVEIVRPVATDRQPERALVLHVGGGHRIELQLEAVFLGEVFENRDRLLAERRVEMDQAELLALELVHAAELGRHVLHHDGGAVPVSEGRDEDPGEVRAVGRGRQAVGHRQDRDLVDMGARDRGERRARRPGRVDDGVLRLGLLVALDRLLGVVAGLAFLVDDLDAVHAAVALVDHRDVVAHAVADRDARARERAGAIGIVGEVDAVLRHRRGERAGGEQGSERGTLQQIAGLHGLPPFVSSRPDCCRIGLYPPALHCRRSFLGSLPQPQ